MSWSILYARVCRNIDDVEKCLTIPMYDSQAQTLARKLIIHMKVKNILIWFLAVLLRPYGPGNTKKTKTLRRHR